MSKSKIITAVIVLLVAGFAVAKVIPESDDDYYDDDFFVPPTETKDISATRETMPGVYKDGTYSARGNYYSPAGLESITINVTIKDGIITDTSAVAEATDEKSVKMQGVFIENYKQYVVGKSIDEVKLDKVSGSSLTGAGFNDAISKIKTEARA